MQNEVGISIHNNLDGSFEEVIIPNLAPEVIDALRAIFTFGAWPKELAAPLRCSRCPANHQTPKIVDDADHHRDTRTILPFINSPRREGNSFVFQPTCAIGASFCARGDREKLPCSRENIVVTIRTQKSAKKNHTRSI